MQLVNRFVMNYAAQVSRPHLHPDPVSAGCLSAAEAVVPWRCTVQDICPAAWAHWMDWGPGRTEQWELTEHVWQHFLLSVWTRCHGAALPGRLWIPYQGKCAGTALCLASWMEYWVHGGGWWRSTTTCTRCTEAGGSISKTEADWHQKRHFLSSTGEPVEKKNVVINTQGSYLPEQDTGHCSGCREGWWHVSNNYANTQAGISLAKVSKHEGYNVSLSAVWLSLISPTFKMFESLTQTFYKVSIW